MRTGQSGYLEFFVKELNLGSLTALLCPLELITVATEKMLGSGARSPQSVVKGISDFKEAVTLMDVWKSAMIMSGERCVMTHGDELKLKLLVNSLDSLLEVFKNVSGPGGTV